MQADNTDCDFVSLNDQLLPLKMELEEKRMAPEKR